MIGLVIHGTKHKARAATCRHNWRRIGVACNGVWCHGAGGVSGGYAPDLRASGAFLDSEALRSIVHGGALKGNGMPQFEELTEEDLKALQQYIRSQAIKTSGDASN